MELELRLILLFGAVLTMAYFIRQIQKKRMQIDYAIYWALFSGALVALAAFPGIATFGARLLHIQSPANLIYLCLIFSQWEFSPFKLKSNNARQSKTRLFDKAAPYTDGTNMQHQG